MVTVFYPDNATVASAHALHRRIAESQSAHRGMAEAGATTPQIAAVSGHSIESCQKILDVYLPRRSEVALGAITAWENHFVIDGTAEDVSLKKLS
jgi:hypothetical protein